MNIKIKNVSKKIKNEIILDGITLDFEGGHIYGITGRNGSGKTILLKMICGFIVPDSGEVIVNGENIYKKKTFPKNTRAMFDSLNYLNDLSGYENLELLASIQNKIEKKDIEKVLKQVDLYSEKDKKFGKYSLGMKQKVGIAQVLMENPDIMIFDEPFNGLDDKSTIMVRKLLIEKKEEGKIVIIATHIKEDINNLCDVIYKLDSGKLKNEK